MARKKSSKKDKFKLDVAREQSNLGFERVSSKLVQYSQVTSVYIEEFGESVYLKGWEELALLLLLMTHDTYPKSFLKVLVEQEVLNEQLDVTTGDYKVLEEGEFKTAAIPKTDFKLRYKKGTGILSKVILGCGRALGYDSYKFMLNTLPYNGKVELKEVKFLTVTEDLRYFREHVLESAEIYGVQFRGEAQKVKSFYEMSVWLLNRVLGEVGKEQLPKFELANTRGLGITKNPELEVIKIEEFGDTGWYVYYNNSKVQTMEYFGKLMELLEIDLERIKFTIRQLY